MTTTGTTPVIGATGTTGSRTAAQLTAVGHRVKAAGAVESVVRQTTPGQSPPHLGPLLGRRLRRQALRQHHHFPPKHVMTKRVDGTETPWKILSVG
ncbi:SDR family oxidoreductase [Streptomyces sp. TP-A0356]|uniref:SDR family oxidoreductase n=1 Tax=Streptomyces sp. TP-A0356 TaxID=1359208 RepID=UPI0006E3D3A4